MHYFKLLLIEKLKVIVVKKTIITYNMPQLVPFYFINEVVYAFVIILLIHYILSKYILPRIVSLFLSRVLLIDLEDLFI